MAQESNENMKLNKLKPTLDGYGDAKVIARDADLILGLFSPYRHSIRDYEGYNIELFKDNIRFMELIAGREGVVEVFVLFSLMVLLIIFENYLYQKIGKVWKKPIKCLIESEKGKEYTTK